MSGRENRLLVENNFLDNISVLRQDAITFSV